MRHRNRRGGARGLALSLLLLSGAFPLAAERRIGADEAVSLAVANNEGLKRSAISLEAKRRALGLAWNELVPSVTGGLGLAGSDLSYGGDAKAASSASLAAQGSLSASLSISASLGESRKLLRLAYESELISFEAARAKLELQARKRIYTILLDQETLKVARQNIERQKESYAQTEARYKAGLAPELELLSAKVSLAQLGPVAEGYANSLANDLDGLKNLIGLGSEEEVAVDGSLELGDEAMAKLLSEAKTAKAADNRDVVAAAKSLETAISTKSYLERSKLWPSLSLSATVAPSLPLASSGSALSSTSLTTTASATVNFALDNYLSGSKARESIAEAQDGIEGCRASYQGAVKDADATRKSYARSVESFGASLKTLKLSAELAQASYDASMKAYGNGLVTLTSLQSAAGELESAKLGALSKSYDLIAAALDLAYDAGLPLDFIGRK